MPNVLHLRRLRVLQPECRFGVHHDGSSHDIREVTYDYETNLEIPYPIIMSNILRKY